MRLFSPPTFDDPDLTARAWNNHVILCIAVLLAAAGNLTFAMLFPDFASRWLTNGAIHLVGYIGLLCLNRNGWVRLSSMLLISFSWAGTTLLAYATGGGIHAPILTAYLLVVFAAGLLLGHIAAVITFFVCAASGLAFVMLDKAGLVPLPMPHSSVSLWVSSMIYTAVGLGLQYLSVRTVKRALDRAQTELAERRRMEEEKARLEAQFLQVQKMEAVGRLAGGVAHDFNNLLMVIIGSSDLLAEQVREPTACELLNEIQTAGRRGADLTRQLLAFSRRQVFGPCSLDLNAIVTGSVKMLRRLVGEHFQLITRLSPEVPRMWGDASQVEQVLMNLVVNARDAMPDGGQIIIETMPGALAAPGRSVRLTVNDTGCGMDEATQARIFEPFFTTKESGRGTGLGLAMVHGIVSQSGGQISVTSEVGKGTTFWIDFPAATDEDVISVPRPGRIEAPRGSENILVVDDDPMVRRLTTTVLRKYGYQVLEAESGLEAVRISSQHPGPIHLLTTDMLMPGMSGPEIVERLAADRPHMRVLYLSGCSSEEMSNRHQGSQRPAAFLQKPVRPEKLGQTVREVLDAPPPRTSRGASE